MENSLAKDPTICSCEYHIVGTSFGKAPLWGHETLSWVGETHANAATGTIGGAPYGATKRCP
eukprot:8754054-Pyramimonas_sp.AAC.1